MLYVSLRHKPPLPILCLSLWLSASVILLSWRCYYCYFTTCDVLCRNTLQTWKLNENLYRVSQKKRILRFTTILALKSIYMIKKIKIKYLYDKIYTIGYYPCFYSSLRDKILANGGHLYFFPEYEGKWKYLSYMYQIVIERLIRK
jgi:hypothetical protein